MTTDSINYSNASFEAISSEMTGPSTPPPTTDATDATATERHSTKPIKDQKRTELLILKKFRDAKSLPVSNEELFRYVGVSTSAGYRIFRDRPRPAVETRGRRPALSEAQVDQLVVFLTAGGYEGRQLPWVNLCAAAGLELPTSSRPVSGPTIGKHIKKRGWRKCNACSKFWIDPDTAALSETLAKQGLDSSLDPSRLGRKCECKTEK